MTVPFPPQTASEMASNCTDSGYMSPVGGRGTLVLVYSPAGPDILRAMAEGCSWVQPWLMPVVDYTRELVRLALGGLHGKLADILSVHLGLEAKPLSFDESAGRTCLELRLSCTLPVTPAGTV